MENLNEQFSQIYDQYIDKIYRFIYLKVNSEEIAQDITSKVFLKGWQAYQNQGKDIKNPSAFLYQIARNAVIDHYRDKSRSNTVSPEFVAEMADLRTNQHDMAIFNSDVEAVKTAIKSIKPEYQDVVIWYYLDDKPVSEIAEMIDKPAGTVRVMLHRAIQDLKDIIKES